MKLAIVIILQVLLMGWLAVAIPGQEGAGTSSDQRRECWPYDNLGQVRRFTVVGDCWANIEIMQTWPGNCYEGKQVRPCLFKVATATGGDLECDDRWYIKCYNPPNAKPYVEREIDPFQGYDYYEIPCGHDCDVIYQSFNPETDEWEDKTKVCLDCSPCFKKADGPWE